MGGNVHINISTHERRFDDGMKRQGSHCNTHDTANTISKVFTNYTIPCHTHIDSGKGQVKNNSAGILQ